MRKTSKELIIDRIERDIQQVEGVYIPTLPKIDLINEHTKVCLMGSCFADDMGWVLKNENIDIGNVEYNNEMKNVIYPWGTFFTPMNLFDVLDALMNNNTKNIFNLTLQVVLWLMNRPV